MPDDDRLFLASAAELRAIIRKALVDGGLPPMYLYAFDKVDFVVTEDTRHMLPPEQLQKWHDAIEKYRRLHPE